MEEEEELAEFNCEYKVVFSQTLQKLTYQKKEFKQEKVVDPFQDSFVEYKSEIPNTLTQDKTKPQTNGLNGHSGLNGLNGLNGLSAEHQILHEQLESLSN